MAAESDIRALIDNMAAERRTLLSQIESLTDEAAGRAPTDDAGEAQWSVKEQCAHLAEMEAAYRAWVMRALEEESPDLTGVTGGPVAVPLTEANEHPIAELVVELRSQRERTMAMIEAIKPEEYDRTATQPVFGTLTVLQWLRSYYRHDRMHQDQIAGREQRFKPRFAVGREPDQRRTSAR